MRRWTQIRFAVAFVVVAVALGGVWLVPGSASTQASSQAAISTDDCETLQTIGDETPDIEGSSAFDKAGLTAYAEGLSETAKNIEDKKLKKAMNNLADIYEDAGDAGNKIGAVGVLVKAGKRYGKATATFSRAILGCVTSQLTLPKNVTLPGGITIPTLPR